MDTLFAGTLSALTVDIAIYPLDTLKSRLQDPKRHIHFPDGKGMSRGLYQGIGPVLVASLPAAGAFFTSYEYGKKVLAHPASPFSKESNSGLHAIFGPAPLHLAASSIGELVSCAILTPAEILKQRAQVVNKELEQEKQGSRKAPSSSTTLQKEIQSRLQSLRGSYLRGFVSLAGRNLPFTAIQFPIYEHFRALIGQRVGLKAYTSPEDGTVVLEKPKDSWIGDGASVRRVINSVKETVPGLHPDPKATQTRLSNRDLLNTFLVASGSAAGAGAIAALVTTPIDVAKTNIMLDQSGGGSGGSGAKGVFRTMAAITAREGLVGLMRGGLLRTAWTALGAGLYLGSYETGRQWWNNRV